MSAAGDVTGMQLAVVSDFLRTEVWVRGLVVKKDRALRKKVRFK